MLLLGTCRIVYMPPFPLPRRILVLIWLPCLSGVVKHHHFSFIYVYQLSLFHTKCFKVFRCLCSPFRVSEISTISSAYSYICMAIPAGHASDPQNLSMLCDTLSICMGSCCCMTLTCGSVEGFLEIHIVAMREECGSVIGINSGNKRTGKHEFGSVIE